MRGKNDQQSSKGVCIEGGIEAVKYFYEDGPDRGISCGTWLGFGSCLLSLGDELCSLF